jgi:Tfp pilus assembly protein PilO
MIKFFDLLDLKQRRILVFAGVFLFLVVLFHVFIAGGQVKTCSRLKKTLSSKEAELSNLNKSVAEKKKEYERWTQAGKDINYLYDHYFYQGERSIRKIREDLNELYKKTGVQAADIRYEYHEDAKEAIQRISLSLSITGSYLMIKNFLFEIEDLEKFLYVDRISFEDIERRRGQVRLGLSLSVYYVK